MFENAKVGDVIWDSLYDYYIPIVQIVPSDNLPIKLRGDGSATYEGHESPFHKNPRYFWKKFDFPKQERPKRKRRPLNIVMKYALGEPEFIHHEYFVEE